MPVPLDVVVDSEPHLSQINRNDILQGLSDASEMLEHALDQEVIDFVERGVAACRIWLDNPHDIPKETRQTVTAFLKRIERNVMKICHPDHHQIGKIVKASYTMTEVLGLEDRIQSSVFNGLEDYGDVFESLAKILRCPKCFNGCSYNEINPKTNRQYSWDDITQALLRTPEDLRLPKHFRAAAYYDEDYAMDKSVASYLSCDLWNSCFRLEMDCQGVAWHIIKYGFYQETPGGPKLSLRTGQWAQFSAHVYKSLSWLTPLNQFDLRKHADIDKASKTMHEVVTWVRARWFDSIATPTKFSLSVSALELSRRLAEGGDPRIDRSKRSEPLFDLAMLVRVEAAPEPRPFHEIPPIGYMGGDGDGDYDEDEEGDDDIDDVEYDDSDFYRDEEEESLSANVLRPASQVIMDQLRANGYDIPPSEGRRPSENSTVYDESFLGYMMPPRRAFCPERVSAIRMGYELLINLFQNDANDLVVSDLNETLLMAITRPYLYSVEFLRAVVDILGMTKEELRVRHMARIPGRGIACTSTFDGFFAISLSRIPFRPYRTVAEIIGAFETGRRDVIELHGMDKNVSQMIPLYDFDIRKLAYPVIRALENLEQPSAHDTPRENTYHSLRFNDLILTFHALVRDRFPMCIFGTIDINTVIQAAGHDHQTLDRHGITRHNTLGLIRVTDSRHSSGLVNISQVY